jgi:hypothetical protein
MFSWLSATFGRENMQLVGVAVSEYGGGRQFGVEERVADIAHVAQ